MEGAHASVQTADDGSIPGATEQEKQETYHYWQSYNLDTYYEQVKDLTFASKFVPVTEEDVRALLRFLVNPASATSGQKALIDELSTKIDNVIAEYNHKAFVKLGSRSPKDAVDKLPKIIPILQGQLQKFPKTNNGEFLAMRYAIMEAMAVDSAAAAFDVFSYSSRIISDFNRDLAYSNKNWQQCVCIREFCPIPLEGELRAFVHNGKLTGLSQYYTNCFFPWLTDESVRADILERVKIFHEALKASVPDIKSYIIDLVVHKERNHAKHKESGVTLVELNPWTDKTGSALFNWQKDKEILENGPCNFRVIESERPIKVGGSWQMLIDKAKKGSEAEPKEKKRKSLFSRKKAH